MQNTYYRKEIRDPVFNIDRWKNGIVTTLMDYGVTMWKERCNILHAEKNLTENARYREFLMCLQHELRTNSTAKKLNVMDRYLLK